MRTASCFHLVGACGLEKHFVTRKWHRFSAQSRADWVEKIRWRYDPLAAARLPDDFAARDQALKDCDYVLSLNFSGPFWQLRKW